MRKRTKHINATLGLCALLMLVIAVPVMADESMEYSIARGGRLYDKWFKENGVGTPEIANPAYPDDGKYKGKKGADWRCKECHGWDYQGNKGAYSAGKHYTGVGGIRQASSLDDKAILEILRNDDHRYDQAMLSDDDARDLALFVQKGQLDMAAYIDTKTNKAAGNAGEGQKYYETICATCHGLDGKEEETPPLGQLANKNPWEVMHKVLNGQPAEEMPALRALDISVVVDVLSYMQEGLPTE